MFSQEPRCIYARNQLADVICQIQFPAVSAIGTDAPAEFQQAISEKLPKYAMIPEPRPPKVAGTPGNLSLQSQAPVISHRFTSEDGLQTVILTGQSLTLSCSRYDRWEEFAGKLDLPLASFLQLYKPDCLERISLRYLNFISRNGLGLTGTPFRHLIQSRYLGILADEDVSDGSASRSSVDAELAVHGGCRAKIHAGPGMVRQGGKNDPEAKFVFDLELFLTGKLPVNVSAGVLQALHAQAFPIFRDAITTTLHQAMEPRCL